MKEGHTMLSRNKRCHPILWIAIAILLFCSCSINTVSPPLAFTVTPWPRADALFHSDSRWQGADDAYSVDLGDGRVLWLFGDSLITGPNGIDRSDAVLIRNSVAIQKGYNPARSKVDFYWRETGGVPDAFFPVEGQTWLWPGDGERIGRNLLLFFMEIGPADNPLGFAMVGWRTVLVSNPDDPPLNWRLRWLQTPPNDFRAMVGSGSVFARGEHLYALAYREHTRDVLLARWDLAAARRGNLEPIQWWCGTDRQWVPQGEMKTVPTVLFSEGQAELTVHHDPRYEGYLGIQTVGFGPAHVAMRHAPYLTGPWSDATQIHAPKETAIPDVMIYAAKAHPHLIGADLVLTYCTNSFVYENVLKDNRLYYPRFLKISRQR